MNFALYLYIVKVEKLQVLCWRIFFVTFILQLNNLKRKELQMNIIFIKLQRMFNFNLQNKAFDELNAEQFRIVYFLNNTLSMVNLKNNTPNNNTIEMYNGYMMDKLGLSVRMIQYHIKALEQLGYIIVVRPIGRNARKQPNKITINNAIDCVLSENNIFKTTNDAINDAINCAVSNENTNEIEKKGVKMASYSENNTINNAINDAMDCTLNKKEIKNKENINNLSTIDMKDLGPKVDEIEKENKKEKVNEMKNAVLNEMERKDKETLTSTSGERNTNFNVKEPVYGNLTDELFDEIFGLSSTEVDDDTTGDKVSKTENEMSDKGTSVMNAKSEMTTSTQGNDITSNSDNDDHKVQSDKVASNCSIFTENCPRNLTPPNSAQPPLSLNAAGDVETRSVEQLPTREDKNAPEGLKTQNNAYNLQEWMTKYNKLISKVENTDVEDGHFDTLLDEGCKLFENFPTNEGNYKRQMQDIRYWVARYADFKKSFKISEKWNK